MLSARLVAPQSSVGPVGLAGCPDNGPSPCLTRSVATALTEPILADLPGLLVAMSTTSGKRSCSLCHTSLALFEPPSVPSPPGTVVFRSCTSGASSGLLWYLRPSPNEKLLALGAAETSVGSSASSSYRRCARATSPRSARRSSAAWLLSGVLPLPFWPLFFPLPFADCPVLATSCASRFQRSLALLVPWHSKLSPAGKVQVAG